MSHLMSERKILQRVKTQVATNNLLLLYRQYKYEISIFVCEADLQVLMLLSLKQTCRS